MAPLYDLGNTDPTLGPAYNPTPLGSKDDGTNYSYYDMVYKAANSSLGSSNNNIYNGQYQQVTLVVPASATSSMWDYYTVYNVVPGTESDTVSPILPIASSVKANAINNCAVNPIPNPQTPSSTQTAMLNLLFPPPPTSLTTFFDSKDCYKYTNPLSSTNQSMEQYFSTSLDAVKSALTTVPQANSHYLGITLYGWHIPAFNDLLAGKDNTLSAYYANGYISKTKNNIALQGPPDIKPAIWSLLNTWENPAIRK